IVEPNQPKGQRAASVEKIRRGSDYRPGRGALAQHSSWISGRKAMFEIGFGGQLGDLVSRELAAQEAAKHLTKFETRAFELQVLAGGATQIDERECTGALCESLYAQH